MNPRMMVDGVTYRPRKWHETRTATVIFSGLFLVAVGTICLIALVAFG